MRLVCVQEKLTRGYEQYPLNLHSVCFFLSATPSFASQSVSAPPPPLSAFHADFLLKIIPLVTRDFFIQEN